MSGDLLMANFCCSERERYDKLLKDYNNLAGQVKFHSSTLPLDLAFPECRSPKSSPCLPTSQRECRLPGHQAFLPPKTQILWFSTFRVNISSISVRSNL